jgi:N-acetylglucosamine-6-phosphate deacetylase
MRVTFPGLFDLQANGFAGVDFNAPGLTADDVSLALARMRETGVTRVLPTLVTSPFEDFASSARVLASITDDAIVGIHMEGPYLSPEDGPRGAHPGAHVSPASADDFDRRQDAAGGRIVLVTLAPEVPGALALIERLVAAGVRVALGHTAANPQQIAEAIRAGATLSTHLGNGCATVLARHPNVIWEQLAADGLHASLIVDGHHLPASTVKAMVRAKGIERTILVTDAIAAAGCPPGRYRMGAVECELGADGRVSLPGTPSLAGSSLTMERAVANTVRFTGLPIDDVIAMASLNPARYMGTTTAGTVTAEWDPEEFVMSALIVHPGSDRGQTGVRPGSDRGQTRVRPPSDPEDRSL